MFHCTRQVQSIYRASPQWIVGTINLTAFRRIITKTHLLRSLFRMRTSSESITERNTQSNVCVMGVRQWCTLSIGWGWGVVGVGGGWAEDRRHTFYSQTVALLGWVSWDASGVVKTWFRSKQPLVRCWGLFTVNRTKEESSFRCVLFIVL